MWERASPDAVGFLRFHSVGETLQPDWAGRADCFGGFDCVIAGVFVGVILGEEHFRDLFALCTTVCGEDVQPLLDERLSAVRHKLILLEVHDE